eukprot:CAMPEP_0172152700 /NCGR_PEP_ID=MMETSP1050-20130122/1000_1 /TAXON_ID=233186 /ORGANISM="Cryptomonas curvata, Strain CCAP979/52" /LENGTH=40 /DNA_ID= /DNA_START= /DNA_END= /DNA_ORIENTATION=
MLNKTKTPVSVITKFFMGITLQVPTAMTFADEITPEDSVQ